ncbi:hypothetical protein FOCC_FOCC001811 [Frankliniella occidentalis]|nr:hypothetical protein FOCC_FOCC001811 [Frankliniella occidentalis]
MHPSVRDRGVHISMQLLAPSRMFSHSGHLSNSGRALVSSARAADRLKQACLATPMTTQTSAFHCCTVASLPNLQSRLKEYSKYYVGTARSRDTDERSKAAEDVLFDMFKNEDNDLLPIGKFLAALRQTGLRKNDPRLFELSEKLRAVHRQSGYEGGSPETQKLDRETFRSVIQANMILISRAFRHQFVIPDFAGFTKHIEDFYYRCKSNSEGKRFSIGDVTVPFTLQSCSKPLTYAIALDKLGPEVVHSYVGQEPSGRNFNELILDYNKRPHNPMINAGAILVCSLLKTLVKPEMTLAEKFDYTMNYFKRLAGGEPIGFNNAVFLSEREAADRNYALGFYMREHKCYPEKTILRDCMDFYFQCCSMEADCESMAVMAATLANGGICPTTEEKVLKSDSVRDVLSLMHSCGMYDYSGQFAFKVGLPAKSGVCGGMLIVIPNVMGIFTWSPPLDPLGNSCRGIQFCDELVREFNFHRYDNLKHAANKRDPRRHKYETKGLSIVNLLFSAASGDLAALRRHRLSGMDMTLSDYDGRTALHLAAAEGHLKCVQFLLEQWGHYPIDEAQTFGHSTVVEYMRKYEDDLDTQQRSERPDGEGDQDKMSNIPN